MSTFAKKRALQKVKVFLNEGAISGHRDLGLLGGQMAGLYDGPIFGGVRHT